MPPEILHLSNVVRSPLVDRADERIGRVEDLIIKLGQRSHPPIAGLVARIGSRELFVPMQRVASIERGSVQLEGQTLNLGRFERRPGEMLLAKDLSARHLINIVGARLIRANEIELACVNGIWEVVGVDPSGRGVARRLLPRAFARHIGPGAIVDWESIEPFVAHVPTARLHIPYRKLAKLRPAQIADLVEAASHEEGEEIIEVVGQDRELEADVFEELESEHQREFLASRSDVEAARLLANMAPDDAADLIVDLDQERRLPILAAMPYVKQAKIRALLSYNPETAGGLMNPDFLALSEETTVAETLDAIRRSDVSPEALVTIYALDVEDRVSGTASVVRLLKAVPSATLRAVMELDPVTVRADADIHAIIRTMTDFNLSTTPVIDAGRRIIGIITVDDVLELLIPEGWRKDFGMTTPEA
jgi:hypothetical protein